MKKVLFVDDEPAVLEGLQDSLRKQRRRWEMTFACGGDAAISELKSNRYDVIVSDVRMPGVDGVDVLQYAKDHHPKTIRIALTGFSDQKKTIKLTSLAQCYLTKPCDVEELDEAITRDTGLIAAFDNPAVQLFAGSASRLPGSDAKQQELMDLLNGSDGSIDDIAQIVEQDIALTAKILQLSNSSFFRRQKSFVSAKQAASFLGVDIIRSLVLANQLFEITQKMPDSSHLNAMAMHQHSLLTATIASEIIENDELSSTSFTAGLLHDVGKIIIAIEKPDALPDLQDHSTGLPNTWVNASIERDILGCTHSEVGGYFLNLWGIPTSVVEAVTFHDNPSAVNSQEFDAIGAVHVANYLSQWTNLSDESDALESRLDRDYLDGLGVLGSEALWKEQASEIANGSAGSGSSDTDQSKNAA